MQLSNTIKTLVLTTLLSPWLAFAGNGLEDGNQENDITPPGGGNDTGISNPTPGIFFDAVNEGDAVWEWNLGVGKAGDKLLCTRSYDNDTRAVGSYRDSFCIAHDAPEYALKVGTQGVGIGTSTPFSDLTISDVSGGGSPTIFMNGPNGGWVFQTVVNSDGSSDGSDEVFVLGTSGGYYPFAITEEATGILALVGPNIVLGGANGGANLGIGTVWDYTQADYVEEAVDVVREEAAARFQLTSYTNTGSEAPQYIQRRARGNFTTPQAINSGDNIGIFSFRGHTGSGFTGSKAGIFVQAAENWSTTASGTKIKFYTTTNGGTSIAEAMEITHDGHIKVGGTQLNVPDYVFEEDYQLMPLKDLDAYVKEQRHLPDVPSEATIKAEGLNVTKTQMLLLKKIEELTLYTIQQQNQIEIQRATFQNRINLLEQRLAGLEDASSG